MEKPLWAPWRMEFIQAAKPAGCIFCIFPALMVVLMGPAMIQIYRVLLPTMGGN